MALASIGMLCAVLQRSIPKALREVNAIHTLRIDVARPSAGAYCHWNSRRDRSHTPGSNARGCAIRESFSPLAPQRAAIVGITGMTTAWCT